MMGGTMRTIFALLVDIHIKCIWQQHNSTAPVHYLATLFASSKNNLAFVITSKINHDAPVTIVLNEESMSGTMTSRLPLLQ